MRLVCVLCVMIYMIVIMMAVWVITSTLQVHGLNVSILVSIQVCCLELKLNAQLEETVSTWAHGRAETALPAHRATDAHWRARAMIR